MKPSKRLWLYYWYMPKNCLGFSDVNFIFNVEANVGWGRSDLRISHEYSSLFIIVINLIFMFLL